MSEPQADLPSASARAEATFITVLTGELGIDRTPSVDLMCKLILYRLVQRGFVLVPLPDDIVTSIDAGASLTEAPHGELQGNAVPQGR